jgi:hypothetical protein
VKEYMDNKTIKKSKQYAKGGAVKKADGGLIESAPLAKPKKAASIKQSATLKKAQTASASKRAKPTDPTVAKFASGGLAKRAEAMAKPKVEGLPPRDMNVKARFVPKMAKGGVAHSDEKQDKVLIKKAIRQHDKNMHGGKTEKIALKKGGKIKK